MSKSTEKSRKKYADTYKWMEDEAELLLMVTKEYKTEQITKSIDWESCVDKYGKILKAYSAHYARRCCYWKRFLTQEGWVNKVSFNIKKLKLFKVRTDKLGIMEEEMGSHIKNCLQWWFALFLTSWCPLFIANDLKTSFQSLMYRLRKFITAAFIWMHDIKLQIRAPSKEAVGHVFL